jgi:hypothetical protein
VLTLADEHNLDDVAGGTSLSTPLLHATTNPSRATRHAEQSPLPDREAAGLVGT